MSNPIQLSDTTRDLILQIQPMAFEGFDEGSVSIERRHVLSALRNLNAEADNLSFLTESLRASLLSDLRRSLIHQPEKAEADWISKLKLWMLMISGTILAIYGGYDAISPFLPLAFAPVWVAPIIITLFIACSVASFYAFDLSQISENIGVSFPESRHMLEVLSEQAQDIRLIGKYIKNQFEKRTSEHFNDLYEMVEVLQLQQERLSQLQVTYQMQLDAGQVSIVKWIASILTGILFFSGGFFVGQDPTIAICSLLGLSVTATAMTVFILCLVSGVAAFALYWYVERPGVDQFVSHLFGLDKEKVAALNHSERSELTGEENSTTSQLAHIKQQLHTKINQPCVATQTSMEDFVSPPLFRRVTGEHATHTEPVECITDTPRASSMN